jgi:hypothetical protein
MMFSKEIMAMILTRAKLTELGKLNRHMLDALGVPTPYTKGWKDRLVGKEIPDDLYARLRAVVRPPDKTHHEHFVVLDDGKARKCYSVENSRQAKFYACKLSKNHPGAEARSIVEFKRNDPQYGPPHKRVFAKAKGGKLVQFVHDEQVNGNIILPEKVETEIDGNK